MAWVAGVFGNVWAFLLILPNIEVLESRELSPNGVMGLHLPL